MLLTVAKTCCSTGTVFQVQQITLAVRQLSHISLKSGCSQRDVLALFLPYLLSFYCFPCAGTRYCATTV